jgi:hypothetical protein
MGRLRAHARRNAVSYLAIGVALAAMAGSAYAALQVRSGDIVDGQVKRPDVGAGAVASQEAANRSLSIRDLGSNSVATRAFGTVPKSTQGKNNPIAFSLANNRWTQKRNETDVFFGRVRLTKSGPCTDSGGDDGFLMVRVKVDGELISGSESDFVYVAPLPNGTHRQNILLHRPYLFESGSPQARKLTATVADSCANPGEDVTVDVIRVIPVGMR